MKNCELEKFLDELFVTVVMNDSTNKPNRCLMTIDGDIAYFEWYLSKDEYPMSEELKLSDIKEVILQDNELKF